MVRTLWHRRALPGSRSRRWGRPLRVAAAAKSSPKGRGRATYPVKRIRSWSGYLGRSLSVDCHYDKGYVDYNKYWCRGADWLSCETVVQTTGSEAEVKAGRTSIKDNQTLLEFTVRLDNLTLQDAGIYWCAIERAGSDPKFPVNITVLPVQIFDLNVTPEENLATTEKPGERSSNTEQPDLDPTIETTTSVERSILSPVSTNSWIYMPFLISISLKTPILLCTIFTIIWMHRSKGADKNLRRGRHSES